MSTVYVVVVDWYEGADVCAAYSSGAAAEAHGEALESSIRPGFGACVEIWPLEVKDAFTGLENGNE